MLIFDTGKTCWQALSWQETPSVILFTKKITDTNHIDLIASKTALLDNLKQNVLYYGPWIKSIPTFPHLDPEGEKFSLILLEQTTINQVIELGELFIENFPDFLVNPPSFFETGRKPGGDREAKIPLLSEIISNILEHFASYPVESTPGKGNPTAINFCPRISTNFHELLFATDLHGQSRTNKFINSLLIMVLKINLLRLILVNNIWIKRKRWEYAAREGFSPVLAPMFTDLVHFNSGVSKFPKEENSLNTQNSTLTTSVCPRGIASLVALPLFLSTNFCPRISTNYHELLFATIFCPRISTNYHELLFATDLHGRTPEIAGGVNQLPEGHRILNLNLFFIFSKESS